MERSRNIFRGLPLVPDLLLDTHVYLWTRLRLHFLKRESINLYFGFVSLRMSSLFGLMVKKAQLIFGRFEQISP